MKYLKAYLKICEKHCEHECKDCPFAPIMTKSSNCHSWILHNEKQAQEMIADYISKTKAQPHATSDSKCGFYSDGNYVTRCRNCGKAITVSESDLIWDDYVHAFLFTCPKCGAEDEVPASAKKVGAKC